MFSLIFDRMVGASGAPIGIVDTLQPNGHKTLKSSAGWAEEPTQLIFYKPRCLGV
jgi:hypothetical protein